MANTAGGNCGGPTPVTDGGYNISDDGTCGFGSITGANGQTLGDSVNPLLYLAQRLTRLESELLVRVIKPDQQDEQGAEWQKGQPPKV